jgi:hypothetical protein
MRATIRVVLALIMFGMAACTSTDGASDPPQAAPASSSVRTLSFAGCRQTQCDEPLEPGRYRATFYGRTLGFEIPSQGWMWHSYYNFRLIASENPTEGVYSSDSIVFLPHPAIATRDCEDTEDPNIGRSVDDLVGWLEDAPGLVVSEPIPVDVGGLRGMQLDLELDPTWKRTCFWSEGLPAVPLVDHEAANGAYNVAMVPEVSMRWYVLDTEDGVLIIDIDDGPNDLPHEEMFRTGTEIVDSFVFS